MSSNANDEAKSSDTGGRHRTGQSKAMQPRQPRFMHDYDCNLSKAQLFQDLWVLSETGSKREGFFVEIGAYDGVTLSNTYLLEKHYGWTGILAEPNPRWSESIRATRDAPLVSEPVHGRSGQAVSMLFVPDAPELSAMAEFAFNDNHARTREVHEAVEMTTISLNDVLSRHQAPDTIDFLSIDTEGNELSILEAFDFDRYDVRLMSVEHNHTAAEHSIRNLLAGRGYKQVYRQWSRWDGWFRK